MIQQVRRLANVADFCLRCPAAPDELRVTAFEGHEALSRLYQFSVEVVADGPGFDPQDLLAQPACLEIDGPSGPRVLHGIVIEADRVDSGAAAAHYRLELAPALWLLTQRSGSRIFQASNCADMSVPGIVAKVLRDAGLPEASFRFALQHDYPQREYVVQYRESDCDFVFRLLEQEGIFFYFEHASDGHVVVFGDGPVAFPPCEPMPQAPFRSPSALLAEADAEFVTAVCEQRRVRPSAVRLDDFDFKRPPVDLTADAAAPDERELRHTDYPGKYADRPDGQRYARVRLEAAQATAATLRMRGSIRCFEPGRTFALTDHPSERLNAAYLITAVRQRGVQPQSAAHEHDASLRFDYQAEYDVMPAHRPFRPARVTPRPVVTGSQTAIVVGPSDEEIYTDKYGRVKVQFHWDRDGRFDEHSSCWIRASQGLAGGNYGMMFLPRVGQEVIVDFLEGDPDRPIITGRVYNNDHMPPYALPEHRTRSCIKTNSSKGGKGTNEIRFEDKRGGEQLMLFAQRAMHLRSRGSTRQSVGCNHHLTVARDKFELVKENKHATVKLDFCERIEGAKQLDVIGAVREDFGAHDETVQGVYGLFVRKHAVIEALEGITLRCMGSFITIDRDGVWINGQQVNLNSGGAPLHISQPEALEIESPRAALGARPGHDTRYTPAGGDAPAGGNDPDAPRGDDDPTDDNRSWIEIEMVDQLGRPWRGEAFEIQQPDGDVVRGTLDAMGRAHVGVRRAGVCQVRFPRLDADTWRRANA